MRIETQLRWLSWSHSFEDRVRRSQPWTSQPDPKNHPVLYIWVTWKRRTIWLGNSLSASSIRTTWKLLFHDSSNSWQLWQAGDNQSTTSSCEYLSFGPQTLTCSFPDLADPELADHCCHRSCSLLPQPCPGERKTTLKPQSHLPLAPQFRRGCPNHF